MEKYVGLDIHATTTTAGIIDGRGKRLGSQVLETNGRTLIDFIRGQGRQVHLCLEEGTQAGWLVEILSSHVSEVVVVQVQESRGQKRDELDAYGLAEMLRRGAVDRRVFKYPGKFSRLQHLVRVHATMVQDTGRTQNRIKALFRSRGIPVAGRRVYQPKERSTWVKALPVSCRGAAELLLSQYDGLQEIREQAERDLVAESHRHPITRVLETCPGLGPIRVARLVAVVVTPHRFRSREQFWAYCGLGIVTRSSSDWMQAPNGAWVRAEVKQTRGLNPNHNRMLKDVFKGAAMTVIATYRDTPIGQAYDRLTAGGTKPNLAKLTVARKVAATALVMWKNEEAYDPNKGSRESR